MESDELYIKKRCGNRQPFSVPSGYFDDFSQRMSERLPVDEHDAATIPLWRHPRVAVAVAVLLCLLVGGAVSYFTMETPQAGHLITHSVLQEGGADSSIDCVADYTMLDNDDIYALVSNY